MNGGADVRSTICWADGSRTMRAWTAMGCSLVGVAGGSDRRVVGRGGGLEDELGGRRRVGQADDVRRAGDLVGAPGVRARGHDAVGAGGDVVVLLTPQEPTGPRA